MAAAVLTQGDAGVGHAELHVEAGVADAVADLVKAAAGKDGKGAGKGNKAHGGQTGGHVDHVGLGNAGIEEALRELVGKGGGHGSVGQVGIQNHNFLVFFAQGGQGFAVGHAYCFLLAHINPPILQGPARAPARWGPCRASQPDSP